MAGRISDTDLERWLKPYVNQAFLTAHPMNDDPARLEVHLGDSRMCKNLDSLTAPTASLYTIPMGDARRQESILLKGFYMYPSEFF